MRIRTLAVILMIGAILGTCIWYYGRTTEHGATAIGAGGLPLIKAETNPAKLPPEEPGGDVMPNADSTVFAAMSEKATDPSMRNIKSPDATNAAEKKAEIGGSDFAGLRTGFAVPSAPALKTENLFDTGTASETDSKYFSGVASAAAKAEVEKETAEEPAETEDAPAAPETEKTATPAPVVKQETAQAVETKPKTETAKSKSEDLFDDTPEAATPAPVATPVGADHAAQDLEAQEKQVLVRPESKPPVPAQTKPAVAEPAKPPVAAAEVKKEEPKKSEIKKPEAKAAATPAPAAAKAPVNVIEKYAEAPVPAHARAQPIVEGAKPATAKASAPATAAPQNFKSGYYIQLASALAGGNAAQDTWARLQRKYDALGGVKPIFVPATVPGKGDYVRIQAGPFTEPEARERCQAIHLVDAKGGCLVFRR